jgi:hypothetical protein
MILINSLKFELEFVKFGNDDFRFGVTQKSQRNRERISSFAARRIPKIPEKCINAKKGIYCEAFRFRGWNDYWQHDNSYRIKGHRPEILF